MCLDERPPVGSLSHERITEYVKCFIGRERKNFEVLSFLFVLVVYDKGRNTSHLDTEIGGKDRPVRGLSVKMFNASEHSRNQWVRMDGARGRTHEGSTSV